MDGIYSDILSSAIKEKASLGVPSGVSSAEGFKQKLLQLRQMTKTEDASSSEKEEALKKAAQGMEAMFISLMFKNMRMSIPKGGIFPLSNERELFTFFLDEEIAQQAARGRGIGIAQILFKQLKDKI